MRFPILPLVGAVFLGISAVFLVTAGMLDPNHPVLQQTRALALLSDQTRGGRFGDGAWYFAGRPM
jgi:hypothetical protein